MKGESERARPPLRVLITGGGTGGHVYPALSVLEAWQPAPELLWVGKKGGMEGPLIERAGIPYRPIAAGGLASMGWTARLRNSVKLTRGFGEAWQVVRNFKPDVVFATGGYVTFPVGLAAWMQRVPIAIYLPDIVPGLAVRALAPLAQKVAVTTEQTVRYFGDKAEVTGYPVRQALARPKPKSEARAAFDLPDDGNVLLVTGGSQGSHSLNEAIGIFLQDFLQIAHVIHVHGKSDGEWLQQQREALPDALHARYHLHEYLHETMVDALLAADLVVARAGASALGEFPAAGLPAVLVPLPIASVNQEDNAQWLAQRGAAVALADTQVRMGLLSLVQTLFGSPARLAQMAQAARAAAHPQAAAEIVNMLEALAAPHDRAHQERQTHG